MNDTLLDLEERKFALEREKLSVEKRKLWLTPFSFITPTVIAAATIGFGFWSQNQRSKADFELKAAEIVMNSPSGIGTLNKAKALADLFPNRMPANFASSFSPSAHGVPAEVSRRDKLIGLLIEHYDKKSDIIMMWKKLFPSDKYISDFE